MQDFAAIDFETANGQRSSVCSVGVVVVHNSPFDEGCLKAVFKVYQMDYPITSSTAPVAPPAAISDSSGWWPACRDLFR